MTRRMRRCVGAGLVLAALPSCSLGPFAETICARPGIPIVTVEVRDQFGRNAVNGASLLVQDDTITADGEGYAGSPYLYSEGHDNRAGVYTVTVTKPWHMPAVIEGLRAEGDDCGLVESAFVSAELLLLPIRPKIRQVVLPPHGYGFSGYYQERLRAYVEADTIVDLTWISTDTLAATVDSVGLVTTVCVDAYRNTWIKAFATEDPSVRDSVSMSIWPPSEQHRDRCP